jgi:hypothetical protein
MAKHPECFSLRRTGQIWMLVRATSNVVVVVQITDLRTRAKFFFFEKFHVTLHLGLIFVFLI